ncbi:MAG: CDP-alcohol phosphatidyltransferase family protein [Vicinamibacterales bacterium]
MTGSATHVRINTGLLAAFEKRVLISIARRLPRQVSSDHLTLLALASMAGAGAAFWAGRYWPSSLLLVLVALALNWFGDSLDGTVARVRHHERPRYGFYVDHVLDVVGITMLVAGMALSGYLSPLVGLMFLVAYLLVAAEVFLATAVNGEFRMSFLNIGPTELRILLAIGTLTLSVRPTVSLFGLGPFQLFDVGFGIGTIGLAVALLTSVARTTLTLYRAEPLPRSGGFEVQGLASGD